jgi:CheY-like chemotaxis protein
MHKIRFGRGTDRSVRRYGGGRLGPGTDRQHGDRMTDETQAAAGTRILVVEDESMIRMLLDGMLADLGYTMVAEAGTIDEALALARDTECDAAILDVNLNGKPITPVVEVLLARGVPFVFATGYDLRGVPEAYRDSPTLQKPFRTEALAQALATLAVGPASA